MGALLDERELRVSSPDQSAADVLIAAEGVPLPEHLLDGFLDSSVHRIPEHTMTNSDHLDVRHSPTLLSDDERAELVRLEAVVDDNFYQASCALREIRDKQLWRADYKSWEEYTQVRWKRQTRIIDYRIAAAAVIDELVAARTKVQPTKEIQARTLMQLEDSADRVEAWETSTEVYGSSPTGSEIAIVIGRLTAVRAVQEEDPQRRQVKASGYTAIIELMDAGKLTPKRALEICDALTTCEPVCRGDMLRLGVLDPLFIREMNRQFQRRTHETYDEIVVSGYLQFEDGAVPANKATVKHLRALLERKRGEYIGTARMVGQQMLVMDAVAVQALIDEHGQQVFKLGGQGQKVRITIEWSV